MHMDLKLLRAAVIQGKYYENLNRRYIAIPSLSPDTLRS